MGAVDMLYFRKVVEIVEEMFHGQSYNSLGKYQILSTIKSRSSMNKTCSKCDSFKLYQRSGRIRDSFQAAYGKSICL